MIEVSVNVQFEYIAVVNRTRSNKRKEHKPAMAVEGAR